jgi:c-di-GMP-binding flagellar brake protein YcgR
VSADGGSSGWLAGEPAADASRSGIERRQHTRVPTRLLTETETSTTHDKGLGRIINLSVGGVLVLTTNTLELHEEIALNFTLPPKGHRIQVRAKVTRVEEGESMGLEFVSIEEKDRNAIREYVQKLTVV